MIQGPFTNIFIKGSLTWTTILDVISKVYYFKKYTVIKPENKELSTSTFSWSKKKSVYKNSGSLSITDKYTIKLLLCTLQY